MGLPPSTADISSEPLLFAFLSLPGSSGTHTAAAKTGRTLVIRSQEYWMSDGYSGVPPLHVQGQKPSQGVDMLQGRFKLAFDSQLHLPGPRAFTRAKSLSLQTTTSCRSWQALIEFWCLT